MKKINRAIISVTDKTGVVEFAAALAEMGVEIISTGGTAELLKSAGITVIPISSFTGFPEMLDGRLKTLHPKIHGGILGIRNNSTHKTDMERHGLLPIDMVVVNLYAFEQTVAKGCSLEHAIENIDIGGPTMIRAAAKNYTDVAPVVDPTDYQAIVGEMKAKKGMLSKNTRFALAKKVYQLTAAYDAAISNYLGVIPDMPDIESKKALPDTFTFQLNKLQDLRYGENPHQSAAFYAMRTGANATQDVPRQLQGKALSYNNILDLSAASELLAEFQEPAAVIVKHNNPCGVAVSKDSLSAAYKNAYACDRTSAFGGIVALNRNVTAELADVMAKIFLEAVIAPSFDEDALTILSAKKNLRLMLSSPNKAASNLANERHVEVRRVAYGALVQTLDIESAKDLQTVTKRSPNEKELEDLLFAWRVCKHVKSNAIIFASSGQTLGIGAGQMSRIDSTRLAVIKSKDAGFSISGAALASDAFFPFRDNIDLAAQHGITAIIHPGGSIKDDEVVKAADEHGIAMVVTGIRHFRH